MLRPIKIQPVTESAMAGTSIPQAHYAAATIHSDVTCNFPGAFTIVDFDVALPVSRVEPRLIVKVNILAKHSLRFNTHQQVLAYKLKIRRC